VKRWVAACWLAALLIVLALTARGWVRPLLDFASVNAGAIQGLTGLVQLALWLGAAAAFIGGLLWKMRRPRAPRNHFDHPLAGKDGPAIAPPREPRERPGTASAHGSGAAALGPGGVAAGAGGVAVGGDVHGSVTILQQHASGQTKPQAAALRRAYLNRIFDLTNALSMAGVDPKAASEAEARLNLSALYTGLFTQTFAERETEQLLRRGERQVPGGGYRPWSC
jgi:hypothetical protein